MYTNENRSGFNLGIPTFQTNISSQSLPQQPHLSLGNFQFPQPTFDPIVMPTPTVAPLLLPSLGSSNGLISNVTSSVIPQPVLFSYPNLSSSTTSSVPLKEVALETAI